MDPAQIPPIGKLDCLPFSVYCKIPLLRLELTEIMRQQLDNPIIATSMQIRENLTALEPIKNIVTTLNDSAKGIIHINAKTERKRIYNIINLLYKDPEYVTNSDFVKVLAWRNKTVNYMNDIIRKTLYGENVEIFTIGDKLIANKPIFERYSDKYRNTLYKIIGNTSDEYIVTRVTVVVRKLKDFSSIGGSINFEGEFWRLEVNNEKKNHVIYVIHENSLKDYQQFVESLKITANSLKTTKAWTLYFNALKWSANISYNYAITVHKGQGSEYKHLILLEEDINVNRNIVERNRIKYTAYSRAINRVYVLK